LLHNLATVRLNQGFEAEQLYSESLVMLEKLFGPDSPESRNPRGVFKSPQAERPENRSSPVDQPGARHCFIPPACIKIEGLLRSRQRLSGGDYRQSTIPPDWSRVMNAIGHPGLVDTYRVDFLMASRASRKASLASIVERLDYRAAGEFAHSIMVASEE
jgi:hypothetical protein